MARQWECDVCGYIHEGETPPAECPICGVGPEMFTEYSVQEVGEEPVVSQRWRCTVCDYVHDGDHPPDECPVCGVDASLFVSETPSTMDEVSPSTNATAGCLLIVGGGVAAVTAAESARKQSPNLRIRVVHKEPHRPYNRLNLTRFVAGEVAASDLGLRKDQFYEANNIELIVGEVVSVDTTNKKVKLGDGTSLEYDELILANGAHPFMPPIPGIARDGVMPLRTLANASAMLEIAHPGATCICIGGGLLGLEVAGGLAKRRVSVTVLEGFDWLLPRQLAQPGGELLQMYLEDLGIKFLCSARIKEIAGDEAVRSVVLESGETIAADLVVMATGVRPNSYLARLAGIEVDHGVLVDDHMRTSAAHVYAAGDVTEHRGVVYGLWPSAVTQGRVAGINAAGGGATFEGLPLSSQLKVLDVALFSIGEFIPRDGASLAIEKKGGSTYCRFVIRDGALVGANLFGDVTLANVIKKAVEEGTQIKDLPQLKELM